MSQNFEAFIMKFRAFHKLLLRGHLCSSFFSILLFCILECMLFQSIVEYQKLLHVKQNLFNSITWMINYSSYFIQFVMHIRSIFSNTSKLFTSSSLFYFIHIKSYFILFVKFIEQHAAFEKLHFNIS